MIVSAFIRSLNRSSATTFRPTPVAPFTGSTCTTVGLVESPVSRVWKVVLPGLSSGCPTRSVISVVSSTVCVVFGRSDAAEVNVTRRLASDSAIEPATGSPPAVTWIPRGAFTRLSGSENWRTTRALTGTPVTRSGGLIPTSTGRVSSVTSDVLKE